MRWRNCRRQRPLKRPDQSADQNFRNPRSQNRDRGTLRPSPDRLKGICLMMVRVLLPPVVVLLLLVRGTLLEVLVIAMGFALPLLVNHGLVGLRLALATGGRGRNGQ